ncbi:MAG TPA: lytic transglycosylase domain-containing protein [Thermoanaerobaculia bacterium]|nr:lytic transglycosylase domain-containing protein [Thermoanaerobaculia bacterium]
MKRIFATAGLIVLASTAWADVRLVVRPDGSKVIVNEGGRGGSDAVPQSTLEWLARQRNRASEYDPLIERHALRYGVDPVLVRAVISIESSFDPMTVSHKGARGLMQLMPATAKRFRVTEIHDPDQNIRGGVAYLAFLLDLHPNDLPRVLASYNAGENAVARHRGIPPYRETRQYVQKTLTVYYGRPWGGPASISIRPAGGGATLRGGFERRGPELPPAVGAVAAVGFTGRAASR